MPSAGGGPDALPHSPGQFATTHWSVVLAAREGADAAAALERLCATYWPPLYAYLRRFGCAPEEAEDLTQDFFASFLSRRSVDRADPKRGRFRTFLLTCLQNYVRDVHARNRTLKRGGQVHLVSLDRERAERGYGAEPAERLTPERVFERRWATTLLEHVLTQLGAEFARTGKREFFEQLKGYVWGEQDATPVRQIMLQFGVSESAVKVTVHRLRQRFRELLRMEIAHTVAGPEEVEDEIRHLAQVLSAP
ncbi:MAG TPA: sigma-70 family RNA polymerase sigma factor [Verrucomicrobiae bacterium]